MNIKERLKSLEVKETPEEPITVLIQVIEKQADEVVVINEYYNIPIFE